MRLDKRVSALEQHQPPQDKQPSAFITLHHAIHTPEAWMQLCEAYDNRKNARGHKSRDDILAERDRWDDTDTILQMWDDKAHCWQLIKQYRLTGDIEAFKQGLKRDYRYSFRFNLSDILLYWRDKNHIHGQLADGIHPLIIGLMFCFSTIYREHYPAYHADWIQYCQQLG